MACADLIAIHSRRGPKRDDLWISHALGKVRTDVGGPDALRPWAIPEGTGDFGRISRRSSRKSPQISPKHPLELGDGRSAVPKS